MKRFILPTVGVLLMLGLSAIWWVSPTPDSSASPAASTPEAPAPVGKKRPPPSPSPVRVHRFVRPTEPERTQPPTPEGADAPQPTGSVQPRRIDLTDLPLADREARFREGMAVLEEVIEACEETLDAPHPVMATVRVDEQGLQSMEIASYDPVVGTATPIDLEVPDALLGCMDSKLWNTEWSPSRPGEEVVLALTLDLQGPEDPLEPGDQNGE